MTSSRPIPRPRWQRLLAVLGLLACLWIGWRAPGLGLAQRLYVPQDVVRQAIRDDIRLTLQLAVQYLLPVAALLFLARGLLFDWRRRRAARR